MDRNQLVKNIRPEISIDTHLQNDVEKFQSITLRPILKFQNDIIIAYFDDYLNELNINLDKENNSDKIKIITNHLKSNKRLKHCLKSLVIALFTKDEMDFYIANKIEIRKRLVELLIQRYYDAKTK
jgi:hypothetical protein